MKWKPAVTAPKHGMNFIAWDPRVGMLFTMHWDKRNKAFITDNERWSGSFTHWQPRPEPPKD